eukprot:4284114-Pyramimonas_sp.AAC.2
MATSAARLSAHLRRGRSKDNVGSKWSQAVSAGYRLQATRNKHERNKYKALAETLHCIVCTRLVALWQALQNLRTYTCNGARSKPTPDA